MVHTHISLCVTRFINSAWIHETARRGKNEAKEIKTSQLQENKGGNLKKDLQGMSESLNVFIFRPILRKQTRKANLLLCHLMMHLKEGTSYSRNGKFGVGTANVLSDFQRYFQFSQLKTVRWWKIIYKSSSNSTHNKTTHLAPLLPMLIKFSTS